MDVPSTGPRLSGRLTAELILRSPQYMNCLKLYHLDLRGNRFAAIENLGATQNQFDCIDLSDNNIVQLEGFPRLERLTTLICNNNRISSIGADLYRQLPNLETLVMSGNRLDRFMDFMGLEACTNLTSLCVLDNAVARKRDFRIFAIYRLKSLKLLNYEQVTRQERKAAQDSFLERTIEQAQAIHAVKGSIHKHPASMADMAANNSPSQVAGVSQPRNIPIKVAIQNAATLEEVHQLDQTLAANRTSPSVDLAVDPCHA